MKVRLRRRMEYSLKKKVSCVVFFFLWRAIRALYGCDSRVRAELDSWPEGTCLHMQAGPEGPHLIIRKEADGPRRLRDRDQAQIHVYFKSMDSVFQLVTGRLGVAQAYAQHRFYLEGDITVTMSFVRCVDIAEGYLFPRFMTRHILKGQPVKELSSLGVYRRVLIGR